MTSSRIVPLAAPRVSEPSAFGRVAVLYGGASAEREVSLVSGAAVLGALERLGVEAHGIDRGDDVVERIMRGAFDRVLIVLHGRGGEDGTIQGALDVLGIPYTGSGVLGSALAMDKHRSKLVWRARDIPTPEFVVLDSERQLPDAGRALGYPRVALVGHSFGGGVVISASRYTTHARGVAALASQTMGAEDAALLGGRPLLVVHGEADAVLPLVNAETIIDWAPGPKQLVTYPGAGHGLRECADELRALLEDWLTDLLLA